jgi:hypothetical protein
MEAMHEKEKEASKRKPVGEMTSADLKARKYECQISALKKRGVRRRKIE